MTIQELKKKPNPTWEDYDKFTPEQLGEFSKYLRDTYNKMMKVKKPVVAIHWTIGIISSLVCLPSMLFMLFFGPAVVLAFIIALIFNIESNVFLLSTIQACISLFIILYPKHLAKVAEDLYAYSWRDRKIKPEDYGINCIVD